MKRSICTDVMGDLSFPEMRDTCVDLGFAGVGSTCGGWSPAPHVRAEELLGAAGRASWDGLNHWWNEVAIPIGKGWCSSGSERAHDRQLGARAGETQ